MSRPFKTILVLFLIWRISLFLPVLASDKLLSYRNPSDYTRIHGFTKVEDLLANPLVYPWANFDGAHYLSIAGDGYTQNARFFPFYPMLIKSVHTFFGGEPTFGFTQFISAFLISNISFFLSLFVFYKLIRIDFPERIAFSSILFLMLFPTSFFFASIYSESLFLLLILLSFYFARKKQWFASSSFALLSTATRIVGIAILPALIYEFIKSERPSSWRDFIRGTPLLIAPIGAISYSFFNYVKWGNPFEFISSQGTVANSRSIDAIISIPQTLFRYGKILVSLPVTQYEWWIAFLELATFFIVLLVLYLGFRKKIRASYLIFSILALLIPTFSGTFTGLPRYALVLFPIFITMALIKSNLLKISYVVISAIILFILFMFFSKGYYVA